MNSMLPPPKSREGEHSIKAASADAVLFFQGSEMIPKRQGNVREQILRSVAFEASEWQAATSSKKDSFRKAGL